MTLNEVAAKYYVEVEALAECIRVPRRHANERLGRLRKQYGFTMDELRDYVASKQ